VATNATIYLTRLYDHTTLKFIVLLDYVIAQMCTCMLTAAYLFCNSL